MKRSRRVGLLAASASLIILAGCYEDAPPPPSTTSLSSQSAPLVAPAPPRAEHSEKVFSGMEACLADIPASDAAKDEKRLNCISDWEAAKAEHEKTAPKFATLAECQAEFGPEGCGTAPAAAASSGGGSVFMPLLMGYMIGNALSSPSPAYYDRNGGYRGGYATGASNARLKSSTVFVNPQGQSVNKATGVTPRAIATTPPKTTMSTSERSRSSGFGMSRSSGGSKAFGG